MLLLWAGYVPALEVPLAWSQHIVLVLPFFQCDLDRCLFTVGRSFDLGKSHSTH